MYKDLLPIGSIVKLEGAESKLMICGRIAVEESADDIYDYIGCMYPVGMTAEDQMVFFNRDAIERIYFVGYQDEEEIAYREGILDQLGELQVVDGEIVPVKEEK